MVAWCLRRQYEYVRMKQIYVYIFFGKSSVKGTPRADTVHIRFRPIQLSRKHRAYPSTPVSISLLCLTVYHYIAYR